MFFKTQDDRLLNLANVATIWKRDADNKAAPYQIVATCNDGSMYLIYGATSVAQRNLAFKYYCDKLSSHGEEII